MLALVERSTGVLLAATPRAARRIGAALSAFGVFAA
jgi:hypothetical protein